MHKAEPVILTGSFWRCSHIIDLLKYNYVALIYIARYFADDLRLRHVFTFDERCSPVPDFIAYLLRR